MSAAGGRRYRMMPPARRQKTAVAAVVSAVGGMVLSCGGQWGWGLALTLVAIPLALLGFVRSASPVLRGGPLSLMALGVAIVGVLVSVLAMLYSIVLYTLG